MNGPNKESAESVIMKSAPAPRRDSPSITEPPVRTPKEVRETISTTRIIMKLGADEEWVFVLILVCCFSALVACLLKLL
jgi:hypothetical protein